jgi:uncharacterized membrane protein YtjA (UPF0391 family)
MLAVDQALKGRGNRKGRDGVPVRHFIRRNQMGGDLIYYAIIFLIVALVAAALGFGGVAGTAMSGANLLITIAVVVVIVGFLASIIRRRRI